MRILIAEDDPVAAEILSRTLQRWEYDVTVAHDGAEAWDVLRGPDAPSLAILDWMMPEIDGPEVCRLVRSDATRAHAYLILLTARDTRVDAAVGLVAGADDYIIKPFDPSELMARVRVGARVLSLQDGLAARVEELHSALSQVKQMSALLPICSHCKRIRSDDSYWKHVEGYVAAHADGQLIHSICQSCSDKLSEDFDELGRRKLFRRVSTEGAP